jgi:hypothetical protein
MKHTKEKIKRLAIAGIVSMFFLGCEGDEPGSTSKEPLTFFEEQIVSAWSRYHAYDGSTDYLVLNSDRSACFWEKTNSGSKTDYRSYKYWKLVEKSGASNVFFVYWGGGNSNNSNSGFEYYYTKNEVWRGGYSNLVMTKSRTAVSCE